MTAGDLRKYLSDKPDDHPIKVEVIGAGDELFLRGAVVTYRNEVTPDGPTLVGPWTVLKVGPKYIEWVDGATVIPDIAICSQD